MSPARSQAVQERLWDRFRASSKGLTAWRGEGSVLRARGPGLAEEASAHPPAHHPGRAPLRAPFSLGGRGGARRPTLRDV